MLQNSALSRALKEALSVSLPKAEGGLPLLLLASQTLLLSYAAILPLPEEIKHNFCKETLAKQGKTLCSYFKEKLSESSRRESPLVKESLRLFRLAERAADGRSSAVIFPDDTRNTPTEEMLPSLPLGEEETAIDELAAVLPPLSLLALQRKEELPHGIHTFFERHGAEICACFPTNGTYPLGASAEEGALLRLLLFRYGFDVSLLPFPRRYTTPLYSAFCDVMDALITLLSADAFASKEITVAAIEGEHPLAVIVQQKAREVAFFTEGGPTLYLAPRKGCVGVKISFGGGLLSENGRIRTEGEAVSSVAYKGGFLVYGRAVTYEGDTPGDTPCSESRRMTSSFAVAALPDDETVLCLEALPSTVAATGPLSFSFTTRGEGLLYANDKKRVYKPRRSPYAEDVSAYINIEDELGVVSDRPLSFTYLDGEGSVFPTDGAAPAHAASVFTVGGIRRTRAATDTFLTLDALPAGILSVSAVAANRKRYTLLYNTTDLPFEWDGRSVPPHAAVLLAWDRS